MVNNYVQSSRIEEEEREEEKGTTALQTSEEQGKWEVGVSRAAWAEHCEFGGNNVR
jgi:hypothetical protein